MESPIFNPLYLNEESRNIMKATIIIFCQSWQYSWVDIEQCSQHVVLKKIGCLSEKKNLTKITINES